MGNKLRLLYPWAADARAEVYRWSGFSQSLCGGGGRLMADQDDAEFDAMSPVELARAWLDASIGRTGACAPRPPGVDLAIVDSRAVIDYCMEHSFEHPRLFAWLLALADLATTELEISIVGAGPIEDELKSNMDFARTLESRLEPAKLIKILSAVWIDGSGKDVEDWYDATMLRAHKGYVRRQFHG